MVNAPLIDVHVHVAESKALGAWSKAAYEIWEYGAKADVRFGGAAGDVDDLLAAMRSAGIDHAVVVNAFSIDEWRDRWLQGVDADPGPALPARLTALNRWLVETVSPVRELTPFVAVDPWLLSFDQVAAHLDEMRRLGALGVKIHPVEQRFAAADPRMLRVYELCADLDLTVLAHSGPAPGGAPFAEPGAFAEVARAVPDLRLVVAHLGGAAWRQAPDLARRHPRVMFDLSEIVAWVGAPNAPSAADLVRLVREIGVERVLFGSDFPWYDPGEMVEAVRALPGLSPGEAAMILGGNAAKLLPV
jgi:predicted TIM-barrel fold metal-dependent hydrolase